MKIKTLLACITIVISGFFYTSKAQAVNKKDSVILVNLYDSTDGSGWANRTNWLTTAPLSTWFGIAIDTFGNVRSINLNANGLKGVLPVTLGNFGLLEKLNLASNYLTGGFPTQINNIGWLKVLNLDSNQLSGPIPDGLGNLAGTFYKLDTLILSNNQFTGSIPAAISNYYQLNLLALNNNHFSGVIPPFVLNLFNVGSLGFLYLQHNYFTFNAAEPAAQKKIGITKYAPQDTVLPLKYSNYTFSVLAGGTLANNTYNWYKDGVLLKTIIGDSAYAAPLSGKYNVLVTNSAATALTLHSDTVNITVPPAIQDSLILVDLYKSTNGAGWTFNSNWLTTAPVNTWYGVSTNSTRRVTGISLGFNNMAGVLPLSVYSLSELTKLQVSGNNITDTISTTIGNFSSLTYLGLASNKFNGQIPAALGNLANLDTLYLGGNSFTGSIPATLGNLGNLVYLNLNVGVLTGAIPASIGNLSKLTYLACGANKLTGAIPASLGNLQQLQYLILSNNNLSGSLPVQLGGLSKLTYLGLSGNKLNGPVPSSLGNLTLLNSLDLSNNKFTFNGLENIAIKFPFAHYAPQDTVLSIPYSNYTFTVSAGGTLGNNTYKWNKDSLLVKTIKGDSSYSPPLSGSYFVSVTNSTASQLTLYSQSSAITVPANIRDSLSLVALYKSTDGPNWANNTNWLTSAPLRTWYGVTVDVTDSGTVYDLALGENNLTGTLPDEIGDLLHVSELGIGYSPITGSIPASIGNLANLTMLDLEGTELTGTIPETIGNLSLLKSLILNNNSNLSGSIPATIGNLSNLETLSLANNSISGNLPSTIGNLSKLTFLDISYNQLSGAMPVQMGGLASLTGLKLNNNQLSGPIPSQLGNLSNLTSLNLDNNQLSGLIPDELGNLSSLNYLYLTQNKLSSLSAGLGNLSNVGEIYIDSNELSGPIPPEFGKLGHLLKLYLTYNHLNGNIPAELGNDVNLKDLYLDYNNLSGSIPATLGNLSNLSFITLQKNHLSGPIPSSLANFSITVFIDFLNNYFTFDGMEPLAKKIGFALLFPQDTILPLHYNNGKLTVSAGGILAHNNYSWYSGSNYKAYIVADSSYSPSSAGRYFTKIRDSLINFSELTSDTFTIGSNIILPAKQANEYASYEYTDTAGWTHYYYDNNTPNDLTDDTLLLSLKKNGQDIGTVGDGTFAVQLVATAGAGSNTGVHLTSPLITNTSGYWVMNRYWQVTPTHEPTASVGVRFYYNNRDLKDVNGSYPTHNLTNNNLIFYKAVGGNPDPTTNLAGATNIISILPGTVAGDTSWTYHALSDTTQYGEYSVASFSGGGGGGTGNNQALPVVLINFTASLLKNDAQLNWQTSEEVNAGNYTVERSLTGTGFTAIGTVEAVGNSTITQSYKLTDYNAALLNTSPLYYRLKIIDKDGNFTYSKVIKIDIGGANNTFVIYPNPAQSTATIAFTATAAGKYAIEITDVAGKAIKVIEGTSVAGANTVAVDVHNYIQGAYIIKIAGDYVNKQSLKLAKQ